MYKTGMQYGMTCREILDTFLGKERALSRGKYPASVSEDVLIAARSAPTKPEKKERAAKKTTARNISTLVIEKTVVKDAAEIAKRKKIIADIAQRHSAEDRVISELSIKSDRDTTSSDSPNEIDAITEEYELILASGVSLPDLQEFAN